MVNTIETSQQISLSIGLPEEASKALINSKNFLNETTHNTINNITDITHKSLNGVTESAEKANHSLSKIADVAKHTVTENVGNTANNVSEITNQTFGAITEQAKHTGHDIVNSVEGKFQQLEQLSNTISTEIERTINSLINHQLDNVQRWVDTHPVIYWGLNFLNWGVNHPLFGLVIVLLAVFIIWQLFKAFGRLLEKGLLTTLTAPFKLMKPLFKFSFKPLSFLAGNSKDELLNSQYKQDKLSQLLNRLESIKQEQNDILQEITAIVSANK
ncbi:hypothetical protein [Nostoc sp. FACHB-280]|uniref:hypothetical protein n=1 Tax=Nostoc sp. FACHB-280 TaxID=2692839 RepID=UPI00168ACA4C|nr:hypothetical protein [Nostoc sp. FACHB-280]MBD2496826.1 hypothetical protein [Nostoc sp. FACHB-280]